MQHDESIADEVKTVVLSILSSSSQAVQQVVETGRCARSSAFNPLVVESSGATRFGGPVHAGGKAFQSSRRRVKRCNAIESLVARLAAMLFQSSRRRVKRCNLEPLKRLLRRPLDFQSSRRRVKRCNGCSTTSCRGRLRLSILSSSSQAVQLPAG